MKKLHLIALIVLYAVCLFAVVPLLDPSWAPWFTTLLSVVFASLFVFAAMGSAAVAVLYVLFLTVVFPFAVLVAIGWNNYTSFSELLSSYFSTLYQHGSLWGLESLAPFVATITIVLVLKKLRSNNRPVRTPGTTHHVS